MKTPFQKKKLLLVFLFLLLLGSPLINLPFWKEDSPSLLTSPPSYNNRLDEHFSRGVASFDEKEIQSSREKEAVHLANLNWAKSFLRSETIHSFNRTGRKPSQKDVLKYGFLKGKYILRFYKNKVEKIKFLSSLGSSEKDNQPLPYFDARKFIKEYSYFFPKKVQNVQKFKRKKNNQVYFYEVYFFTDAEKKYKVQFEWDFEKNFLSLRVAESDLFFF